MPVLSDFLPLNWDNLEILSASGNSGSIAQIKVPIYGEVDYQNLLLHLISQIKDFHRECFYYSNGDYQFLLFEKIKQFNGPREALSFLKDNPKVVLSLYYPFSENLGRKNLWPAQYLEKCVALYRFSIVKTPKEKYLLFLNQGYLAEENLPSSLVKCLEQILSNKHLVHHELNLDKFIRPIFFKDERTEGHDAWAKRVNEALSMISEKKLEKLVLSRLISGTTISEKFSLCHSLKFSQKLPRNSRELFCSDAKGNEIAAFPPEKILSYDGNFFRSEAVAGTISSDSASWVLLADKKALNEQEIVTSFIEGIFKKHLLACQIKGPAVKIFGPVAHLVTLLEVAASEHKGDPLEKFFMLLDDLHPTPAVGGLPKNLSIEALQFLETETRGAYSSPIGILSENYCEVVPAIRLAFFSKNEKRLSYFVGAGIVAGSTVENEWEETEKKGAHFKPLFH